MVLTAVKVLTPLAVVAALLANSVGALAGNSVGLTNVAGTTGDCAAPARDAACATLFDGTSPLYPGGPAQVRQVRIAYSGGRPVAALGLYTAHFVNRAPQSQPYCQAADPASMLDVSVAEGLNTLYSGTLDGLAQSHGSAPAMLRLPGPWTSQDAHTYTIAVSLEPAAGNPYMGCASTADFVWLATQ